MSLKKNKTPAQLQRAKLAAAIKLRGERGYNIWLVRPPFEAHDLMLSSDPQVEAFYCVEGEPTFAEISYLPQWYELQGRPSPEPEPRTHDLARITATDERALVVRLALGARHRGGAEAATLTPVDGVISLTLDVLNAHAQRIENWRRIISCIRRARFHGTAAIERRIALALCGGMRSTIRAVHRELTDAGDPLFYAAVARLLRHREICADVDSRPWSENTQLWSSAA